MISRRTLLGGITLSLAGGALVGTRPAGASPVTVDEIGDRVQTVVKARHADGSVTFTSHGAT